MNNGFVFSIHIYPFRTFDQLFLLSGFGSLLGILVVIGALLTLRPERNSLGGFMVLLFSLLSIFTASGLIPGIIGIIGGVLAILNK